ncbi:MAG TPA: protein kinase [Chthoniobacterales bacterium]|jgi:serine/threonine-protein kinase|nr:protein kinase [Chthoniobacterales bacterium]
MIRPNESAVLTAIGLRRCENCGATIAGGASGSFCGACLLEEGLQLLAQDDLYSLGEPDFGDYELSGEIGRGGQGIVYRARQRSLNRIVALKVIGRGPCASESHLKRFRREAEAAASLQHPRIVPIYEIGERDGACFFSMQLIEGGQLDELVRREPPSAQRAAKIVASLARTVQHAHERGILHRDIKPGNILLDREGEPLLADFGLARLVENESTITRTLEVLGTPSYIAPEQATGDGGSLSKRTDVYGLGAVLYFLLTGHPPFAGGTTYETIRLVLETEPRSPKLWNPKIDCDLTTICLKCLEKNPERRYATALALAEDLERWLGHEPIQARRSSIVYRGRKWIRRNPSAVALCSLGIALLGLAALLIWNRPPAPPSAGLAVLPFANLDGNKENAAFADGIQNDILTRLAHNDDLNVISRTSVMNYRGVQNARAIGRALNVSHVLEGGVRRDGQRVHLNVQLIDTQSDQPIWGEEFDRDLQDVFGVQSEIARDVADALEIELSPEEKAALQNRPSKDPQAYDLYVLGAPLVDSWTRGAESFGPSDSAVPNLKRGVELLDKAVARDPKFFIAYCKLAKAHDSLTLNTDSSADLAKAQVAIDAATRLAPKSGETHLARALHLYWGHRDYNGAHAELALARRTLPNDARIPQLNGYIDRRQGHWDEAVREFRHAVELDPQDSIILHDLEVTYNHLRRYDEESATLDRALAASPNSLGLRMHRAGIEVRSRADLDSLDRILEEFVAENPSALKDTAWNRFDVAFYRRDLTAAGELLSRAEGDEALARAQNIGFPHAFFEGWVAEMKGETKTARERFLVARAEQEKAAPNQTLPKDLVVLGLIDAFLGRKSEAMAEGRQAMKLMPLTKDAWDGPQIMFCYAAICAWSGERDLALGLLQQLARVPAGVHYGHLVLDPLWDPLREDPRFETIVRSLGPNELKR